MGILYIVIIAAVVLVLLFVYDKRASITSFLKTKFFKPKPLDIPKAKPKIDTDTIPNADKMKFGKAKMQEQPNPVQDDTFEVDNIFSPKDEENLKEDIDLDRLFEEMRRDEAKKNEADREAEQMPNFDNMSMEELDNLLENNFKGGQGEVGNFIPSDTSGEDLGKVIRNLPPQLKVLLASGILKRKDDDEE